MNYVIITILFCLFLLCVSSFRDEDAWLTCTTQNFCDTVSVLLHIAFTSLFFHICL